MGDVRMIQKVAHARRAVLVIAAVFVVAACGTTSSTSGTPPATNGLQVAEKPQPETAKNAMTAAFKGTNRQVDTTSRPAVKGKHIVVISGGDAIKSNKTPTDGAVAAATAMGWKVDRVDAQLSSANYQPLIRQATGNPDVDGIVLDAIDC